ncbi:MAG: FAD-binding oxidoreductase [Alphaproteobacteria bacterium]|nr:FAD-binding oxidoreductase [Alphaproteobacteria bacterium]
MTQVDYLVIGAGMSGASVAYELAAHGTVAVLEAESAPGYHSTGRSAALYTRNYGPPVVQRINAASHRFFVEPPPGFADQALLRRRGALTVAAPGDEALLDPVLALAGPGNAIERVDAARAVAMASLLRPELVGAAAFEPGVMDMDVAAIHQGYLRGMKRRGATLVCDARVARIERRAGLWHVEAGSHAASARIVVNAAGAWADQVAHLAGVAPVGLVPKRRTAIIVEPPAAHAADLATMPAVDFAGADAYIKPDAGRIMASPGDQSPVAPQDIQPEELDIAMLVDFLERRTHLAVRRIARSWAGLRSFVADSCPVVGFDPLQPDFFWLAGQGGFGIMMAPALSQAATTLIREGRVSRVLADCGVGAEQLSPARLRR